MAAAGEWIIGARHGGDGGNLIAQRAGNTIGHAAAQREARNVDAMGVNTVVLLQIGEEIAGELDVIGVACRAISAHARIPRWRRIHSLWKNEHKSSFICLYVRLRVVLHDLCCPAIAVIADDERLRMLAVGWGQMYQKGTLQAGGAADFANCACLAAADSGPGRAPAR